ncbi:Protein kinase domain protein [Theileria parva strain Muguga]|uniref:Protein kinase domain protein n=1 Tax=Theileria parva strain Muguga TaxID=333668 RepID=UPI001C6238E1|nr:Protein kinase domain protein [Theileria parva strain Muguga]KAF5153299.1 Protein kinase domain protein [Theileria parva strain Muguga]
MESRTINIESVDSTIPLVFVNVKENHEVFVVPSDYPYKHNKINSPENSSTRKSVPNIEYTVLPKLVKTPRRTLVAYSPPRDEQAEKPYKVPFEELFGDDVRSFLENNNPEADTHNNYYNAQLISEKFVKEIKKNRRHYIFSKQWKRNALNKYLIDHFVDNYSNKLKNINQNFVSKILKNQEYSELLDLKTPNKPKKHKSRNDENIKDWRRFNPSYFKPLNDLLNDYHDYLYKKQEKNRKTKHMASSVSRYFFEILAEAKECERKMYECELIAEENTYGRRDFISEFHRETNMLKKRWRKLYTVSLACLRRSMDPNKRVVRGMSMTPSRPNPIHRTRSSENVRVQSPSPENEMAENNQHLDMYLNNRNENTTPMVPMMQGQSQNYENLNYNYTDDYNNQDYNSSRETTIPFGVSVSNNSNAKEASSTQINIEQLSEDEDRNLDSKTRCNAPNTNSTNGNQVDQSTLTPSVTLNYNQNDTGDLIQRDNAPTSTPSRIRDPTSSVNSIASYNEFEHNENYSNRVPSGGVNKWIYSKMEERGEMEGYHLVLHELGMLMFSGGTPVLGFTSVPHQLEWLDETESNRVIVPPSQDSFRDGTLYTTCCYSEIKLMKVLQSSLYMLRTSKNKNKDFLAFVLEQILEANSELFELKKKLDNGRSALYKKLKLHWAERNSKWGGFPPLKRGYRLLNMLGKGGFAEVWEVFDPITLTVQAAKLHILSHDMDAHERGNVVMRVKNEIDIHKNCRTHPNIVNMKACFEMGDNMLATILELCDDGDLDRYIKLHGPVPEKLAITWTYQILQGLYFMKTLPEGRVHHCDLKPGNILNHRGNIKLADFGLSKVVRPDENEVYWGGGGTIWYQPPECLLANTRPNVKVPLTDKIDIWAVGCILYEMLFNSRPFGKFCNKSSLSDRLYKEAKSGVKFPQTYKVSEDCKKLIQSFLAVEPNDRPSIEEALNCPIFYFE